MITAEQRETRRKYIGSSDAAAILGFDPYRSAADVWLEKTGRLNDWEGNEATDRGIRFEPVLLDWAKEKIGKDFSRDIQMMHFNGVMIADFDGLSLPPQAAFIVEAKSSVMAEEWGEDHTDAVPDRVRIQVHHQFAVAGPSIRLAYVPVLLPGYRKFDFRMYEVPRNDELCETIEQGVCDFHAKFIKTDTPPGDYRPSIEVVKRIKRVPERTIAIPDLPVTLYRAAQAKMKAAKEDLERAQADLISAMGDAEAADFREGTVTYLEYHRSGYTVKPTSYRMLKIEENKA